MIAATSVFQVHESQLALVAARGVVVIEDLIEKVSDVLLLERVLRLVLGV